MSKELETQPYRVFKEYLDKIITMPDNIKNELVEIFEKKRLEKQKEEEQKKEEQEKEEEPVVQQEEEPVVQQEEEPVVQQEEEPVVEEEDKNSLFNRFFSQSQSLQQTEQKPVLNPPQHKCKIRDW
jgi:hypothetical protein